MPIDMKTAWAFFSSPKNLSTITPPEMGFEVLSELPEEMYPGMFIKYNVRPLLNIPLTWVTEITQVEPGVLNNLSLSFQELAGSGSGSTKM